MQALILTMILTVGFLSSGRSSDNGPQRIETGPDPPPVDEELELEHVVATGESLLTVAKLYAVCIDDLASRNGVNGMVLEEGQVLAIPVIDETEANSLYIVEGGDSVLAIADRHQVEVDDLIACNGITEPDVLLVGDILVVPDGTANS